MKNIIFLFLVLIVCSLLFFNFKLSDKNSKNDILELSLTTNKQVYLESELVWFNLDVIFDKNIKLDYAPYLDGNADLSLILVNSKNDTLPYHNGIPEFLRSKEYPDTMNYFDELTYAFGIPEKLPSKKGYGLQYFYLPADNYKFTISVNVSVNHQILKFYTNTIIFTILEPYENEKDARNEVLNIEARATDGQIYTLNEFFEFFDNFSQKYSTSVYLEKIFHITEYGVGGLLSPDDAINYYKNFIINHPDYYSNIKSLYRLKYLLRNNITDFKNFLKDVSIQKEGTIISKYCKQILMKLE